MAAPRPACGRDWAGRGATHQERPQAAPTPRGGWSPHRPLPQPGPLQHLWPRAVCPGGHARTGAWPSSAAMSVMASRCSSRTSLTVTFVPLWGMSNTSTVPEDVPVGGPDVSAGRVPRPSPQLPPCLQPRSALPPTLCLREAAPEGERCADRPLCRAQPPHAPAPYESRSVSAALQVILRRQVPPGATKAARHGPAFPSSLSLPRFTHPRR